MDLVIAVLCVLIILLLAWPSHAYGIDRSRFATSRVDGLDYRVHPGHRGQDRAADMLARLNAASVELLRGLKRDRAAGRLDPAEAAFVARLVARYSPDSLVENSPLDPSRDTSYSIDKGETIALCLREREAAGGRDGDPATAEIHDFDVLLFVVLHELTHVGCDEIGHPPAFWEWFRFLLRKARVHLGYEHPDFEARPRRYCGLLIDYNP